MGSRSRAVLAAALLAGALALVGAAWRTTSSARDGGKVVERSFTSRALRGRLRLVVWVPPGYGHGTTRYPVIYFLHGLPASSRSYRSIGFLRVALQRLGGNALLVAPQGARAAEPDPEYLDRGPGRNWETAIARDLPAYVDAHFRTIDDRRARALVGLSAGGYGAVLVAFHHLESFSVVESWSGYFHPTNPAGTAPLDLGSRKNKRASAHNLVARLRSLGSEDTSGETVRTAAPDEVP